MGKKGDEMLSKIYNLLNYCYEDSIEDKFAGLEFQLFLLSTKSLIPFENKIGCELDINRYRNEMEVFRYYKNGNDDTISYYSDNSKPSNMEDELLEYKIIPIIISNTDWETLIEEVMKIVILYSYNEHTILNSIILSSVVFEYFYSNTLDIDSIKSKTNNRLIEFSLKEFIEKKLGLQINKKNLIDFEKERINLILKNNCISEGLLIKFKVLQHIINNSIASKMLDKDNEIILNNFVAYILKLRKGTVNPEKLICSLELKSDFKEYLKSSSFMHPLLGKCIVIKRDKGQLILKNKLGLLKVNI